MVFISYSREDYDSAIKIKNLLKENGIECWMDQSSISAGDNYLKEIPNAIKGSSVFLLVLSHNAQESKWVLLELDEALNRDIVIIPFKIDDEKLNDTFSFVLRTAQWIDAVRDSQSAYSELLSKVRQASGFTRSDEVISDLPKKYTYFQMFGINDISQISIEKLRSQTDITVSMSVPIGINTNHELVHLDLHQRGDGPNGLIVGPPGSGKSDFLNTLS